MPIKLTILGPNLFGFDHTFHIHSAGCADLRKRQYRGAQQSTHDFDSLQEVVEDWYDGQLQDNADDPVWSSWEAYADEFKVFPCVKGLS
jgi:hypothetical protein